MINTIAELGIDNIQSFTLSKKIKKKKETTKQQVKQRNFKRLEKKDEAPRVKKEEKINLEELQQDSTKFVEVDETRASLNIIMIGHVDAGKSTLCGRILVDTG